MTGMREWADYVEVTIVGLRDEQREQLTRYFCELLFPDPAYNALPWDDSPEAVAWTMVVMWKLAGTRQPENLRDVRRMVTNALGLGPKGEN